MGKEDSRGGGWAPQFGQLCLREGHEGEWEYPASVRGLVLVGRRLQEVVRPKALVIPKELASITQDTTNSLPGPPQPLGLLPTYPSHFSGRHPSPAQTTDTQCMHAPQARTPVRMPEGQGTTWICTHRHVCTISPSHSQGAIDKTPATRYICMLLLRGQP